MKAKITKAKGTALDANTPVSSVNLFLQVDDSYLHPLIPTRDALSERIFAAGKKPKQVNFLWPCFTKILLERRM